MPKHLLLLLTLVAAGCAPRPAAVPSAVLEPVRWGMVIHGGAGTINRGSIPPEREAEYHAALRAALLAGHQVLAAGGSSLDAVEAAVNLMEDSPLFNAGRGAVFTAEGRNELDAAIMDGRTRAAGAVAGVTRVKNPIDLARRVMEQSPHVMLTGEGAETFARQQNIELVAPEYFRVQSRWDALQRARAAEQQRSEVPADAKFGTVGAVALDRSGNLAAGTSTGGMTNKKWGRVGDAPIIGAGTYANQFCAVSATGHGEFFIRSVVAYDICALMAYRGLSLQAAADEVVMRKLVEFGGEGGVIAMDQQGYIATPFNSSGMFRGRIGADGQPVTEIYKD